MRVTVFYTSEMLHPNKKIRLRLVRARPNFHMISDTHNVSLGIVDCSFYTRRIAVKDNYKKRKMDKLVNTRVEFNFLETLARTLIFLARQKQFIHQNIFNTVPVLQIAFAMTRNSAISGSYTKNPFWYQQFYLRRSRLLRGGQPLVYFDAADTIRLYVTAMKAMNFEDDTP